MGNALVIDADSEQPLIRPKGGFGGLSGPSVKYTALANVKKFRELLRKDIDVIGVGGVRTGRDAFEMILCGAAAVQVGTCHWIEGPKCFERIATELQNMMQVKGYEKLQEFQGKLKPWAKERVIRRKKGKKNQKVNASGDSFLRDVSFIFLALALLINALTRLGLLDGLK
jgi:dihydroorotate dehydrogenase (fumarate)